MSDIDKLFGNCKQKEDFLLLNHLIIIAKHYLYECGTKNVPICQNFHQYPYRNSVYFKYTSSILCMYFQEKKYN